MNWQNFWTSLGGTAVAIAVLAWLCKKWFGVRIESSVKHEYDKKLEDHKADLQRQTTEAIRKVESGFQDAVDQKATDKDLFRRLLAALPSDGSIAFLRENNFAGFSFIRARLDELDNFVAIWDNAEHEFLDAELEEKRRLLRQYSAEFCTYLARNTWVVDTNPDSSWVPPEWETEFPERFSKTVRTIHESAQRIVETHTALVRLGRSRLKV